MKEIEAVHNCSSYVHRDVRCEIGVQSKISNNILVEVIVTTLCKEFEDHHPQFFYGLLDVLLCTLQHIFTALPRNMTRRPQITPFKFKYHPIKVSLLVARLQIQDSIRKR